jgi:type IV secretory pathway VirB10-like protein
MTRLAKHGSLFAALAGVAFLACAKPDQTSQSADSTARNLTLAPTESTAALKDVPAPATDAAKPATEKKTPVKKPVAPKPAPLMLAAGTSVPATAVDSISTRSAKAGDPFTATVSQDVKDATGRVVIPAGATVSGTITAAEPAPNPNSSGKIELAVTSVTVRGASYSIDASVVGKDTVMKGRGVTGADAAKVAGGAVAGAIVGKLLGKNKKGAVIGGAAGAAAGAAAARQSRDIDVVIPKGAAITIKLNAPLTVKAA